MQSPSIHDTPGNPVGSSIPGSVTLDDVFEGPEKKLEVFFTAPAAEAGFRAFGETIWSDVLTAARCTILHCQRGQTFDAYLLSESSLFVYPSRLILKTCGATTLLLVLPRILELAADVGSRLEHVHYSHFRYKFPTLQVYPHTSFDVEKRCLTSLLDGHIGAVRAKIIGCVDASKHDGGHCWYALCTEPSTGIAMDLATCSLALPSAPPAEVDNLFEVAMEGLSAKVCSIFFESAHRGVTGKALARSMTDLSGIRKLLTGVEIDDWAFSPCGYSMNGSRGPFYYTIHITPELDFSYASFETNDPTFRAASRVRDVVSTFQPAVLTITLTTRPGGRQLPKFDISGYDRMLHTSHQLTAGVEICCASFQTAASTGAPMAAAAAAAAVVLPTVQAVCTQIVSTPASAVATVTKDAPLDGDATNSEASSEDTCELMSV